MNSYFLKMTLKISRAAGAATDSRCTRQPKRWLRAFSPSTVCRCCRVVGLLFQAAPGEEWHHPKMARTYDYSMALPIRQATPSLPRELMLGGHIAESCCFFRRDRRSMYRVYRRESERDTSTIDNRPSRRHD